MMADARSVALSALFLLFAAASVFGLEKPEQFAQVDFTYAFDQGYEGGTDMFSAEYGAFWEQTKLLAGVQANSDVCDFTVGGAFFPSLFNLESARKKFYFGVCGIYHFQRQSAIASENDFLLTGDFNLFCECGFSFKFQFGYGFKGTKVDAVYDYVGFIWDKTFVISLDFQKEWGDGWEAHIRGASHSLYRYPLFVSPIYDFGLSKSFPDSYGNSFQVGGDFELRITDEFTTAPYINGVALRLSVRYLF